MIYAYEEPFDRLSAWLAEAEAGELNDPNALYLATVDGEGRPSLRTVLLKGLDARGPVFYTNLTSRKGRELLDPHGGAGKAAILFHWKSLERQVRLEGVVEQVSEGEADAYFASRHRASQIGAHASAQSQPLASAAVLQDRVAALTAEYAGRDVPRPAHWSGFRLVADRIEFWRAGTHRLHDREELRLAEDGRGWHGQLLCP